MALIIAGDRSGVGKTTVTLAILAYLATQGERVQSFKVGPDYIDPMFHCAVTDLPCRNLDPVLTSPSYVLNCFQRHIDCSSLSTSIAAIAHGYRNLDPNVAIAGVILNQVASDRHEELLETALNSIKMPILGVLRRNTALTNFYLCLITDN